VDHDQDLGWKGKKDRFLLPDASDKGYDARAATIGCWPFERCRSPTLRNAGRC